MFYPSAFDYENIKECLSHLRNRWILSVDKKRIKHQFDFSDFPDAIIFADKVAEMAERENAKLKVSIEDNSVLVEIWTSRRKGLGNRHFALAKQIEELI